MRQATTLWILLASLGLPGTPLRAEPRPHPAASVIEFSEDGLPIIQVVLHALKPPGKTRTCRFLVSTGQDATIIDDSVPTEFYWDASGTTSFPDAAGASHALPAVLVKRLEVAGLMRDGVAGARADLKQAVSAGLDEPVDGILGMSFLSGTRFVYDPGAGRILWWQEPAPGVTLPLVYSANHLPLAMLTVGTTQVPTSLDIARMGGLDLPWSLKPAGEGQTVHSQVMLGDATPGQFHELGRVEAGAGAWTRVRTYFQQGMADGGIGQDVWSAAPAGFDFIQDRLTLHLDAAGRLPIRAQARLTLPVFWDRSGPSPRLIVMAVKAGTPMAEAGCRPGDELVRAGTLSGRALNRRSLMALMDQAKPHAWIVLREGKPEQLRMFEAKQGD